MEDSGKSGGIGDIELALRQLHFMRGDIPESRVMDIDAWEQARRSWIGKISLALEEEQKKYADRPDEMPPRFPYAAFTLLALLVSERFGELLRELCGLTQGGGTGQLVGEIRAGAASTVHSPFNACGDSSQKSEDASGEETDGILE